MFICLFLCSVYISPPLRFMLHRSAEFGWCLQHWPVASTRDAYEPLLLRLTKLFSVTESSQNGHQMAPASRRWKSKPQRPVAAMGSLRSSWGTGGQERGGGRCPAARLAPQRRAPGSNPSQAAPSLGGKGSGHSITLVLPLPSPWKRFALVKARRKGLGGRYWGKGILKCLASGKGRRRERG